METPVAPEVAAILERSREIGFLGPQTVAHQIEHALGFWRAAVSRGLSPTRGILDLGSGGGLPGLVVQACWPRVPITLLDGSVRRCEFLAEAVEELGVADRVHVRCGRAEELGRLPELRAAFDLVVARSFGQPAVLAECAAPFLELGGHLLVSEPPDEEIDTRWPIAGVAALGLGAPSLVVAGSRFAMLTQAQTCPDRFPRRTGIPTKRPLF